MTGCKLVIRPSFYVAFLLMLAFGHGKLFFITIFFVTLHELSHVLAARMYKLRIRSLTVFPMGEIAEIDGMDTAPMRKQIFIYCAGPLCNICIGAILMALNRDAVLVSLNFAIGLFNLLPFFPLDGSKIFWVLLNRFMGTMESIRIIFSMSRISGYFLIALGVVQVILFPFNCSLLFIGLYMIKISGREKNKAILAFYQKLFHPNALNFTQRPGKIISVSQYCQTRQLVNKLNLQVYHFFYIWDAGIWLDEKEFIRKAIQNHLTGTVADLL